MFLLIGNSNYAISQNQCIIPGDTSLCNGEAITYCVNVNQLPSHDSIRIEYDLYIQDTWDGNGDFGGGPDNWYCILNNTDTIFNSTFSTTGGFGNSQSYPDQYVTSNGWEMCDPGSPIVVNSNAANTGAIAIGPNWAIYRLSHTIAHSSSTAPIISFNSGLNEAPNNESWGMDNVEFSIYSNLTGWQLFYEEDFNLILGTEWNGEAGTNCALPLSPLVISTNYSFDSQIGIGPFFQNTKINLDINLAPSNNPNISVLWSTGDTTQCITVIPNANTSYSAVIQDLDSAGNLIILCSDTVNVTLYPDIDISAIVNDNSQNGFCDGDIFTQVNPPGIYTYEWDTAGTPFTGGAVIQNLCEQIYCLTVTDQQTGCDADTCFTVEWNPCNLDSVAIIDSIDCFGEEGTISITIDTLAGLGPVAYNPFLPRFVVRIYSGDLPPYTLVNTVQTNALTTFQQLFADDYMISVYDRSWDDSCYTNITLNQPDPILIYTTVDSTSAIWINDGSILIDSITGGNGGFSWTWHDSSYVNVGTNDTLQNGGVLLDSLFYSHEYFGGYAISVQDILGCDADTIIYVYPRVIALCASVTDTAYVTCFDSSDAQLQITTCDTVVPPLYYYWRAESTVVINDPITGFPITYNPGDIIRVDSLGSPFYNPNNHLSSTLSNLPAGFYGATVYDAFHGLGGSAFIDLMVVMQADSIYVEISPDIHYQTDSTGYVGDSIVINCGDSLLLSAEAFPLPANAQLMPDTNLVTSITGVNSFTLDFTVASGGTPNGERYRLYDAPNRSYMIECSGIITDTAGNVYDPAFTGWDPALPNGGPNVESQDTTWAWNQYVPPTGTGQPPLLDITEYDNTTHTYRWVFDADDPGLGPINDVSFGSNMWKHKFSVETIGFTGQFQCQVYSIVDTVMYEYIWYTVDNPTVLSTSNTLLTDPTIITTVDYVVQITNTNNCPNWDTIRVAKNLDILSADSIIVTDVEPCFGDTSGRIDIYVDTDFGISPYSYSLYDVDTNALSLLQNNSWFTSLGAGIYITEITDDIGCIGMFKDTVFHPDTIYACGIDTENDTIFDIDNATVNANDPSTWNFSLEPLMDNFQYYLEVSGNFGLTSLQLGPPYWEDAAYETYTTGSAVSSNRWGVILSNGDTVYLRPDNDVYNPTTNTYIYHLPTVISNSGTSIDPNFFVGDNSLFGFGGPLTFFFNDLDGDTVDNQGSLTFTLHQITCTRTDTAYTCKGEGLAVAYIRPFCSACGIDDFGGVPFIDNNGDEYYKVAWVAQHGISPAAPYQAGDTVNASTYHSPTSGDTVFQGQLYAGFYHVIVEDKYGCTEFERYLNVLEPVDTFKTIVDTVVNVVCKNDNTGEIHITTSGGFDSNASGWSSSNVDGSGGSLASVSINHDRSRYTILLRDILVDTYNACNDINTLPNAVYTDTIAEIFNDTFIVNNAYVNIEVLHGIQDSIIFNGLYAGRYRIYVYDAMPEEDIFGYHDPFTGQLTNTPFNYLQCPEIHDMYIQEPCDSLFASATLIDDVTCFGDSTAVGYVTAIGGIGPYTYQWDNAPYGPDSLGEIGNIADSLWADTALPVCATCPGLWHTVTAIDAKGCTAEDSIEVRHINDKIQPILNIIEDSVSCFGDCDGVVALSSIGGVFPHEYTWDVLEPGNSGQNHTSLNQPDTVDYLCPGGHTILIIDDVGCEAVVEYRIEQPDQIYAIASLTTPISCYDYNDGSGQVYGIGGNGTSPSTYQYSWVLDPSIYNSISDSSWVNIFSGDTIFVGSELDNNTTNFTDSVLPPGIHVVTVTDYKGCSASDTVEFIEPTKLELLIIDTVYAYCEFTESASLCAQAFGGTPNYVYQFNDHYSQNNSGNATGANDPFCATSLTPVNTNSVPICPSGNYYVTVLDERGCFEDLCIDIDSVTNSFNLSGIDDTSSNISCFNGVDGFITIQDIVGGMGTFPSQYTIDWTGPNGYSNNLFHIAALEAGTYAAVISDSAVGGGQSCDVTFEIQLTEPDQLLVTIYDTVGATCYGDGLLTSPPSIGSCDGQIYVSITGGTPPYRYDKDETGLYPLVNTGSIPWPGDSLIDGLCGGMHTIYVTDSNNCTGSQLPGGNSTIYVNEGVHVTVSNPSTVDASCANEPDGQVDVNGPNSLFGYIWAVDPLPNPPASGDTGNIPVPSPAVNLYPGNYNLVAQYAPASNFGLPIEACNAYAPFTIGAPAPIVISYSVDEPDCFGENDGSINITVNGGTAPYGYSWVGPNGFTATSEDISSLFAGVYTVSILDAADCSMDTTIILGEPDPIQNNFTVTPTICHGEDNGIITAQITGGTFNPPANNNDYDWSPNIPVSVGGNNSFTWQAPAGTYLATIEDDNGCELEEEVIITEPDQILVDLSHYVSYIGNDLLEYTVSCNGGSNGQIIASVTGGTGSFQNFTYDWSQGTPDINMPWIAEGVSGTGIIQLDVTDEAACPGSGTLELSEPDEITADADILVYNDQGHNVSCLGANDGRIALDVEGGITNPAGVYNYTWSPSVNHPVDNDGSIGINLSAGNGTLTYTVTVEDFYGCQESFAYTLTSPEYSLAADVITLNYAGPGNVPYAINFQDQTTDNIGDLIHLWCWDYNVEWNGVTLEYDTICANDPDSTYNQELFTHLFNDIGANDIYVLVRDAVTGCEKKIDFTIDVQGIPDIDNVFSPNGDGINDVFSFGEFGMDNMNVSIFNRWGEQVYSWDGDNGSWDGKGVDGEELSEGVYFYVLKATGADGYYYEKKGSITLIR